MSVKGRIMLIDDEPIVCERLKPTLEKVGLEVEAHTDSQTAIDRLAKTRFDVVVTDVKMRGPDGLDILQFIGQHHPSTKVIIITGFATVETARQAMKSGAVDFLAKPFKVRQLRDLIISIVKEQHGGE